MRKIFFVLCVFVIALSFAGAEGQQDFSIIEEPDGQLLNDGEKTDFEGLILIADYSEMTDSEAGIYVKHADAKPGYELFKKTEIYRNVLPGERINRSETVILTKNDKGELNQMVSSGEIVPLINLDIFAKRNGIRIPIHLVGAKVRVIFPPAFFTDNKIDDRLDISSFSLLDFEKSVWIPLEKDNKEITGLQREGRNPLEFTIERWPHDDKMLCSGP